MVRLLVPAATDTFTLPFTGSLSFASFAPWLVGDGVKPDGVVKVTLYVPVPSAVNRYFPLEFVVVERVVTPSGKVNLTVAPWIPLSPRSCIPFEFLSFQTKSPIWLFPQRAMSKVKFEF